MSPTAPTAGQLRRAAAAALLVLAACTAAVPYAPQPAAPAGRACHVARVVDGDTVYLSCPGAGLRRARLMGFDTPEVFSPRCPAERALGQKAERALGAAISAASSVTFRFHGQDRYGRDLVQMFVDGRNIAGLMVSSGLAVPYDGGRRIDWCRKLSAT